MYVYDMNHTPIAFIDSLDARKHIALFYDESEYARLIEFRFLKNGLVKGEQCVYATEEDSGTIILKMLSYGIPLKYFERKKIRVYQIHNSFTNSHELMENCKNNIGMILADLQSPFRIVSRIVSDVSTLNGMTVELEFERETHYHFDKWEGSVMCPYDLSKVETSRRKEWLAELHENHHEVIYAQKFAHEEILF